MEIVVMKPLCYIPVLDKKIQCFAYTGKLLCSIMLNTCTTMTKKCLWNAQMRNFSWIAAAFC
jgi:hypothetical protein